MEGADHNDLINNHSDHGRAEPLRFAKSAEKVQRRLPTAPWAISVRIHARETDIVPAEASILHIEVALTCFHSGLPQSVLHICERPFPALAGLSIALLSDSSSEEGEHYEAMSSRQD